MKLFNIIKSKLGFRSQIKNRKVTKARFFYIYMIFGSVAGLLYFIASLVYDLPKHWSFSPLYMLFCVIALRFILKNWKLIGIYINDVEQGKLLLYMNKNTHWSEEHKLKVLNWVYLKKNQIRTETYLKLVESKEYSNASGDKKLSKLKPVSCPQQLKDGFNEALLVQTLIYAHTNIQVLDQELRNIMSLTDENMLAFDINKEFDKCKDVKYRKYMEVGKKKANELQNKG